MSKQKQENYSETGIHLQILASFVQGLKEQNEFMGLAHETGLGHTWHKCEKEHLNEIRS